MFQAITETATDVVTPKRSARGAGGFDLIYPYYAGYSYAWAKECLKELSLSPQSTVLDPWNGSGTTTLAASCLGHESIGFDINPIMKLVARARMMPSEMWHANELEIPSVGSLASIPHGGDDPLCEWLSIEAAAMFRGLASDCTLRAGALHEYGVAAATVIAFRALRRITKPFEGSNPTWVKKARSAADRLSVTQEEIRAAFQAELADVRREVADDIDPPVLEASIRLDEATSTAIPLRDESVDAVVTSPPYCTRIDYAVATSRENALLGMGTAEMRSMRDQMIGTSTISKSQPAVSPLWGGTCNALLAEVKSHTSKASNGYYSKNLVQYFDQLYRSLREISRVVTPGGKIALVAQDSFYKEVHIDLPQIISEMSAECGLVLTKHVRHPLRRSIVTLNTRAKANSASLRCSESVVYFQK